MIGCTLVIVVKCGKEECTLEVCDFAKYKVALELQNIQYHIPNTDVTQITFYICIGARLIYQSLLELSQQTVTCSATRCQSGVMSVSR